MKKRIMNIPFKLKLAVTILYLAGITALFVLPLSDLPKIPLFPGEDKLIHGGFYFILALLLSWTFYNRKNVSWKILTFVVFWGFIMETTQFVMHAGRSFSYWDMVANLTGAIIGVLAYRLISLKFK